MYKKLADFVAAFHALFMLALILSGLCVLVIAIFDVQMAMMSIWNVFFTSGGLTMFVTQIVFGGCPLSLLENALRRKYNPGLKPYDSYVVHYLEKKMGLKISVTVVTTITIVIGIFVAVSSLMTILINTVK